ncbi:MAG: chemotaxis protein CheB [Pirellulales bacterium]
MSVELEGDRVVESNVAAVAIGASAGAVEALSAILPALPEEFPFSIFIVVHVPPDRVSYLVELFRRKCRATIREAEDKDTILAGTIYFAPPDYHLLIERAKTISLSSEEAVNFSRPSVDVLFESAADAYGPELLGIVLTGGSDDGAQGLRDRRRGRARVGTMSRRRTIPPDAPGGIRTLPRREVV